MAEGQSMTTSEVVRQVIETVTPTSCARRDMHGHCRRSERRLVSAALLLEGAE